MEYKETIKMKVDDFNKIKINPQQRDTEAHARKACKEHLKEFHESHCKVAIAVCGKERWILDGHTRLYLWMEGELKQPKILFVEVWAVENKTEVVGLYETFDNQFAAETAADKISGAMRILGITNVNKHFIRNTGIKAAIKTLNQALKRQLSEKDTVKLLRPFKKEIQMLADLQWNTSPNNLRPGTPSCVIAAFFVIYRLYGSDCFGFWDGYYCGEGREMFKSGRDGSLAAAEWIIRARQNTELMVNDSPVNIIAILNAYEYYWEEKIVKDIRSLYKKDFKQSRSQQLGKFLEEWEFT